ncbi:MAG: hypothetical protein ACI9P3_000554 [Bradyrhizobium sp.]
MLPRAESRQDGNAFFLITDAGSARVLMFENPVDINVAPLPFQNSAARGNISPAVPSDRRQILQRARADSRFIAARRPKSGILFPGSRLEQAMYSREQRATKECRLCNATPL